MDIFDLYGKVIDGSYPITEKEKMFNEIRKLMPPEDNRWNFRYVIIPLTLVVFSVPVYLFFFNTADMPEALLSLASTALGALAAYLNPAQRRRESGVHAHADRFSDVAAPDSTATT